MLSSVVVIGALAAFANAVPVQERAVTVTEVTDVYTTVYDDGSDVAAPTTTTKAWWWKGNHRGKHTTAEAAPTVTVSTPEAAVTTAVYTTPAADPTTPAYTTPEVAYSTPASSAAPAVVTSTGGSYSQSIVDHHNAHRANHSAPALAWDDAVAATALKIANSCNYAHDTTTDGGGYGQNIAAGCPADNVTSVITELFYNNEAPNFNGLYGQATPSNINDEAAFDGWGHFSQIVWKSTTLVGCATVDCTGKGNGPQGLGNVGSNVAPIFTVCNYKSAGNFLGEFDQNVGESLGHPEIHWNTLY